MLSQETLDNYYDWYCSWATGDVPDEPLGVLPEFDEDEFTMICDIIEGLFEHINSQKTQINEVTDQMNEVAKQSMKQFSLITKEIGTLRKRKSIGSRDDFSQAKKPKNRHWGL
jgi:hypothetical protein